MPKYMTTTKTLRNRAMIEAYYSDPHHTMADIATIYNVSRQRTHELIMRYRLRIIAYHRHFPEATPAWLANRWDIQLPETIVVLILREHYNNPVTHHNQKLGTLKPKPIPEY